MIEKDEGSQDREKPQSSQTKRRKTLKLRMREGVGARLRLLRISK